MVADSLIAEVNAFYKAYAEAFHAVSGARIADFYYTPCLTMRGDGSTQLTPVNELNETCEVLVNSGRRARGSMEDKVQSGVGSQRRASVREG